MLYNTASESLIIDDFEDGDIAEYSGQTSAFSVIQTPTPFEGDFMLEATSNGNFFTIAARNGLPNIPVRGDTFLAELSWDNGTDVETQVRFFTQSQTGNPDCYITGVQGVTKPRNPESLFIRKRSGGSRTDLARASYDPQQNENEQLTLRVSTAQSGTIAATLFDQSGTQLVSVSTSDSDHDTGGVGWALSSGTSTQVTCRWDFARFET